MMNYLFEPRDTLPPVDVHYWTAPEAVEIFKTINAAWLGDGLTLQPMEQAK